jgi:hypothetical protein
MKVIEFLNGESHVLYLSYPHMYTLTVVAYYLGIIFICMLLFTDSKKVTRGSSRTIV